MKYTRTTVLALVLAVLAIGMSACEQGPASGEVFNGGTNALLFSFERDTPPDLIYDNGQTPFQIIVKAKNDGEFDTQNIQWRITGINRNDYPQLQTDGDYPTTIIGTTKLQDETIEGEEAYIQLGGDICYDRSLSGGGELDFTVTANMCYAYATLATSTICVRENYLDGNDDTCDPRTTGQVSVSGAPVTITSFAQQPIGTNKLRLQYEVALKDNVKIWAPMTDQECKPATRGERIAEENWIYVAFDTNELGTIDCVNLQPPRQSTGGTFSADHIFDYRQEYLSGNAILVTEVVRDGDGNDGYLRLGSDNTATLTCTLTIRSGLTDSLGTIDLAMAYYIEDSISTSMTVTHTDGAAGSACSAGSPAPTRESPTSPSGANAYDTCYSTCYGNNIDRLGRTETRNFCAETCSGFTQ